MQTTTYYICTDLQYVTVVRQFANYYHIIDVSNSNVSILNEQGERWEGTYIIYRKLTISFRELPNLRKRFRAVNNTPQKSDRFQLWRTHQFIISRELYWGNRSLEYLNRCLGTTPDKGSGVVNQPLIKENPLDSLEWMHVAWLMNTRTWAKFSNDQ